jgi:hypothetical protein
MTRTIDIRPLGDGDPARFAVTVREDGSVSHHEVTMSSKAFARHAGGAPEQVIDAAFRFLLDREAKESILARFDLSTIARYFPEFEQTLPDYLK